MDKIRKIEEKYTAKAREITAEYKAEVKKLDQYNDDVKKTKAAELRALYRQKLNELIPQQKAELLPVYESDIKVFEDRIALKSIIRPEDIPVQDMTYSTYVLANGAAAEVKALAERYKDNAIITGMIDIKIKDFEGYDKTEISNIYKSDQYELEKLQQNKRYVEANDLIFSPIMSQTVDQYIPAYDPNMFFE